MPLLNSLRSVHAMSKVTNNNLISTGLSGTSETGWHSHLDTDYFNQRVRSSSPPDFNTKVLFSPCNYQILCNHRICQEKTTQDRKVFRSSLQICQDLTFRFNLWYKSEKKDSCHSLQQSPMQIEPDSSYGTCGAIINSIGWRTHLQITLHASNKPQALLLKDTPHLKWQFSKNLSLTAPEDRRFPSSFCAIAKSPPGVTLNELLHIIPSSIYGHFILIVLPSLSDGIQRLAVIFQILALLFSGSIYMTISLQFKAPDMIIQLTRTLPHDTANGQIWPRHSLDDTLLMTKRRKWGIEHNVK